LSFLFVNDTFRLNYRLSLFGATSQMSNEKAAIKMNNEKKTSSTNFF
jgi:hypothetical protein